MPKKASVAAISALIACSLTACVTKAAPITCTVVGAKYLSANASAAEICRNFEERLGQALAEGGKTDGAGELTIAIALHKSGSAEAQITGQKDGETVEYPVLAVDVMDRPLAEEDLDKLADSVAQFLMGK